MVLGDNDGRAKGSEQVRTKAAEQKDKENGMKKMQLTSLAVTLTTLSAPAARAAQPGTFGFDAEFLGKHTKLIVLSDGDAKVAVAPDYQGRVMTSTTGGDAGPSFGWLNYTVIAAGLLSPETRRGKLEDHIYVFGGEERFWLGPEGSQYGIYFAPGAAFDFDSWHTPPAIDTEPFATVSATPQSVGFSQEFALTNYSGTRFDVRVGRTVTLLPAKRAGEAFGIGLPAAVKAVAYETDNRLTNTGKEAWTEKKGLLSIWLLGMYKPSPGATIVIPFKAGTPEELGPKVNDAYFGKIPPEYLKVGEDVLFLKGDGTRRGKIGISPARSKGIAGSYDAVGKVLTLVTYTVQKAPSGYVNSMWEVQKEPYGGDVLNSYNDGSPAPGKAPLGPFYELETSSPAAALKPGATMRHVQRTIHLSGPEEALDKIARGKLGVGLQAIADALSGK